MQTYLNTSQSIYPELSRISIVPDFSINIQIQDGICWIEFKKFSDYYFSSSCEEFIENWRGDVTKIIITRKIKKFLAIQPIPDLMKILSYDKKISGSYEKKNVVKNVWTFLNVFLVGDFALHQKAFTVLHHVDKSYR